VMHGARCKYRTQEVAKTLPSVHHHTTLSGYIFATKARINNRKKNLLCSNISSTCPNNIVNFGPLAAEIGPVVWGTPAHFSGFRVFAASLHSTLVVRQPNSAALNRGATYIRQGSHHVGHWPTFCFIICVTCMWIMTLDSWPKLKGECLSLRRSVFSEGKMRVVDDFSTLGQCFMFPSVL